MPQNEGTGTPTEGDSFCVELDWDLVTGDRFCVELDGDVVTGDRFCVELDRPLVTGGGGRVSGGML